MSIRLQDISAPRRFWLTLAFGALCAVAVLCVINPGGFGYLLSRAVMITFCIVLVVWPHATGARPRLLWSLLSASAALDVIAMAGIGGDTALGILTMNDVYFILAYVGYLACVVTLGVRITGASAVGCALIDSLAAAMGVALVLWTFAEMYGEGMSREAIRLGIYPLLDIGWVTLASHLSARVRRQVPVWPWVVRGATLQLGLDSALFASVLTKNEQWVPLVRAGYPIVFLILALAVLHPSVRHLTRTTFGGPRSDETRIARASLIVFGVALAEVSLLMTGHAHPEERTRTILVAGLILVLFVRLALTLREVTLSEAEVRHRASHDPLTGLVNRTALIDSLQERVQLDHAAGARTGLLHLDLDNFHGFNERFSHQTGDVLLQGITDRLLTVIPAEYSLGRHGGDEFVVACPVADERAAVDVAEELLAMFTAPIQVLPRHAEHVAISIGVAVSPADEEGDPAQLLAGSVAAVDEAKALGGAQVVLYGDELDRRIRSRVAMAAALHDALDADQIRVALQPIHGGRDFEVLQGWEALARWTDPVLGTVTPDQFIPIAEENGMIGDLGYAVLRQSLWAFARLRDELGRDDMTISVNVSAAQLHESGFRERVYDALAITSVPARRLRLEITESLLVGEDTPPLHALEQFRADGIGIALDDFGTGYASVTTLRRLPLTCVKLDMSFIRRLGEEPDAATQIKAVLDLVHSLHIDCVVAEGVETAEQATILSELGCPSVQGWRFGKPAFVEDILAAHGTRSSSTIL